MQDGACRLGDIVVRLTGSGAGRGLTAWRLRSRPDSPDDARDVDGIATEPSPGPGAAATPAHPNGALAIDHVVVATDDRDRTVRALEAAGLDLRRETTLDRGGRSARLAFLRAGTLLVEVGEGLVPADRLPAGRATLWGLAIDVADMDATAASLGERLGTPRPAIQPGRRIATVRREAGLGTAVALMTPRPPRQPPVDEKSPPSSTDR